MLNSSVKKDNLTSTEATSKKQDDLSFEDYLKKTITNELVIALCGPIGTDINFVSKCLKQLLEEDFNYKCHEIKLSDYIKIHNNIVLTNKRTNKFSHHSNLIDLGNDMRRKFGMNILSKIAIHKITSIRQKESNLSGEDILYSKRTCYIINQIKHNSEYELLKLIYNDIFYFIGVFSSRTIRISNLKSNGIDSKKVDELILKDRKQKDDDYGQKVSDTFTKADYFLRIEESNEKEIFEKLHRLLNLTFTTDIVSPTSNETAMYMAYTAAGNSACLSRQVGASITDKAGNILSVGWNDVPKAEGGVYPRIENNMLIEDHRCCNIRTGICFNDSEKEKLSEHIINLLKEKSLIDISKQDEIKKLLLNSSKIKDLLEFSRSVHAEMYAIIMGSQKTGDKMIGGKLFCTTYPCHNCARHIIAAGIDEVYYIEPYDKSLALELHWDAISELEKDAPYKRLKLLMYDGVAPNRYLHFFKMLNNDERKLKDGSKKRIPKKVATPKKTLSLDAIPYLEQKVTKELSKNKLKDLLLKI